MKVSDVIVLIVNHIWIIWFQRPETSRAAGGREASGGHLHPDCLVNEVVYLCFNYDSTQSLINNQ